MNWGDRRESTFKDDADGQRWLERLESAAPRANCIRTGVIRERHHERKEGCAVEDGEGDDDGLDCATVVDGMPAYVGKLFEEVMAYSPIAGTDTFLLSFSRRGASTQSGSEPCALGRRAVCDAAAIGIRGNIAGTRELCPDSGAIN